MANQSFAPITGIISDYAPFPQECCSQLLTLQTTQGIVNFVISSNTYVADTTPLRPGMRVTAFYDASRPVPLIYPPRYEADFITVSSPGESIAVNYFDESLTASDHSLQLNIGNSTNIVTANGQYFHCHPAGNMLMVYYIATTRSIPPQTTPRKIIVFC